MRDSKDGRGRKKEASNLNISHLRDDFQKALWYTEYYAANVYPWNILNNLRKCLFQV